VDITNLESVGGFVLVDLPDAERSVGPVRLGAKLIVSNAPNYARELTYGFALLEQQHGGMTIGLKADPEQRAVAVAAAAEELSADLEAGRLVADPGLRMTRDELGALRAHDPRPALRLVDNGGVTVETELTALGAAVVADRAVGLEGKKVAIEGLSELSTTIAIEVEKRGGSVTRFSTSKGVANGSFSADELANVLKERGVDAPTKFGEVDKPWTIWNGADVDVIFCGSKSGVLTHAGAPGIGSAAVIATGVAPIETKALAILKAAGTFVSPAFLADLGRLLVGFDTTIDSIETARSRTEENVGAVLDELSDHAGGVYLAACLKAESYMRTWTETLPFGRPMA